MPPTDNQTGAENTSTDTRDRASVLAGSAYEQQRINLLSDREEAVGMRSFRRSIAGPHNALMS